MAASGSTLTVRFVDRDRRRRADAALFRAANLLTAASSRASLGCPADTPEHAEALATAAAHAISEAQVAVGLYRQIAEDR